MFTYAYFENGQLVGPVNMRSNFKNIGGWHLLTDEERAQYDWYECIIENESYDPAIQDRSSAPELVFDNDKKIVIATYQIINKSIETIKQDFIDRIRNYRWFVETNGVIIDNNSIRTDQQSQLRLVSLATTFLVNPNLTSVNFEIQPGEWLVFNKDQIFKIAEIVSTYVQDCFTNCRNLHDSVVNVTTIDDLLKIDIYQGWPNNTYSTV